MISHNNNHPHHPIWYILDISNTQDNTCASLRWSIVIPIYASLFHFDSNPMYHLCPPPSPPHPSIFYPLHPSIHNAIWWHISMNKLSLTFHPITMKDLWNILLEEYKRNKVEIMVMMLSPQPNENNSKYVPIYFICYFCSWPPTYFQDKRGEAYTGGSDIEVFQYCSVIPPVLFTDDPLYKVYQC